MFRVIALLSIVTLLGLSAKAEGPNTENAVSIGDSLTPNGAQIPCVKMKSNVVHMINCTPPESTQKIGVMLTPKALQRVKKFCGSVERLNCEYTCVGYLSSPKDYGCSANFAGGPIASKDCEDKLLAFLPSSPISKMKALSDKCHELVTRGRNPAQPPVVDDTNNAVGVGSEEPLSPGPIQIDE